MWFAAFIAIAGSVIKATKGNKMIVNHIATENLENMTY